MSIDLEVFPTRPHVMTWGAIQTTMQELADPALCALVGKAPTLVELATRTVMLPAVALTLNSCYILELAVPNTLGLQVVPNAGNVDVTAYLEDYGRNLSPASLRQLVDQWEAVGYYYGFTSLAGRSKHESRLLVLLVTSVASLCHGYVIVMNDDILNVGVGVYPPEQFQHVMPRF